MKSKILILEKGIIQIILIITGFGCFPLMAQKTITGKVTDENNSGLPGVNVVVKGTLNGTVTDASGFYNIELTEESPVLVFSSVGFVSEEIVVGNRAVIDMILLPDITALEEIVVIGYGTRQKEALTGSISDVGTEKLELNPIGNVTQSLQGMAAGVTVTSSNRPGSDAKIRIRGLGTINNNNPLWVIDGAFATGGINQISPSEIESITILKDAASTAIYGARGANGVILVTTLKGNKSQKPQINFNARLGTIRNNKKYDMLDVDEFGEMLWLQSKNSGVVPTHPQYGSGPEPRVPKYLIPAGADQADLSTYDIVNNPITAANPEGTDWYNEIYNPGLTQEYTMSVTGGSENTKYGFGLGYLDENGMVRQTGFERFTFRSNISTNVTKWLEVGQNFGLSHTNTWGYQTEGGSNSTFGQLLELTDIMPVYDVMGNWAPVSRIVGLQAHNNPVAEAERGKDITRKNLGILGNAYAKISLMDNLSFTSLFGINFDDYRLKEPLEANPESYIARPDHQLTEASSVSRLWNWSNTINYTTTIKEKHNLDLLLGAEAISNTSNNFSATREKFFLTTEDYWVLNAGEGDMRNSGSASDWSTMSYFGRIHYEYDNKYLVDATVRHDGSSRFGKDNRWGTFPSFALGWVLSNENFMSGSTNWLDYLKVRASWGQSGNDQIGNYNGFTTFRTNPEFSYYPVTGSNNSIVSGFESAAFGNPNAKWETTTTINFGFDATLFRIIDLGIDVWQRNTKDMLYPRSIPFVYGRANVPSVNIGDMKNTGIDLQLNIDGAGLNDDLAYSFTANLTHYKNEIVKLTDVEDEFIQGATIREQVYTRAEKGSSFPQFFGYDILGIFQTQEEVDAHPPAFGETGTYNAPGRFKYRDVNGDDIIDDKDRTYIGNPHPDFTAGLIGEIRYKSIDLVANFYASVGNDLLNLSRRTLDFNLFQRNRSTRRLYESWGSPYLENNEDAKMPIAELNDVGSQQPSSYYVEDGSYFRLQSLQVGYNFSEQLTSKISLNTVRIYLMATNLFTITSYSGLDPAVETGDRSFGLDLGEWPAPQNYLIGVSVSF
ncbi:MAG: TonB-dependent receptor [Cytophagales bacterium]|nr:TonB-dependent receptor [Cytophagales bacterium]